MLPVTRTNDRVSTGDVVAADDTSRDSEVLPASQHTLLSDD
jgi:hypothetical protein